MTRFLASRMIAILETLSEVEGGGPESSIYLALGADIELWETIRGMMVSLEWVKVEGNWITLADKGREVVGKLAAAR